METNYVYPQETKKSNGHVLTGLIGALLAAVLGAVIWAFIDVVTERVFALAGLGIGLLVCFGYDLFKGKTGVVRAVIVAICVVLAIVAGELAYYGWLINDEYKDMNDLLTNGTNDEIAQYFFTEDAYAQYQAASIFDKNYNIALIKDEYDADSVGEYFQKVFVSNPDAMSEVKGAFIKDVLQSVFFGLLGSFALIISKAKNDNQAVQTNQVAIENARVPGTDADGYVTAENLENVQNDDKQDPFAL